MNRPANRKSKIKRYVAERLFPAVSRFIHVEALSGFALIITAVAAMIWANVASDSYQQVWSSPVSLGFGANVVSQSLQFWVNDGLMTFFFLVVGMEIRREIFAGVLSTWRMAALPLVAALGGIVAPAAIYLGLNVDPALRSGWAVATATDIAFAVGILALLGKAVPAAVRILLLALAIIDDIAAVLVIAFFYSNGVNLVGIGVVALGIVAVRVFQRLHVSSAMPYLIPGAFIWFGLLRAGIHPALAGVVLGLLTPVRATSPTEAVPPVERVQMLLHPWVAFGVMPIFALANAGVVLGAVDLRNDTTADLVFGIAIALVVGKPLGIALSSWLAVKAGWCVLPQSTTWGGILLVGLLGGIGFTMSIFIATQAFETAVLLQAAKAGVLLGSIIAGLAGLLLGWLVYLRIDFTRD